MKKILLTIPLMLTACQTGPDQFKPIIANPTPYNQAIEICDNKAKAAGSNTAPNTLNPMQGSIDSMKNERYTRRACMAEHGYSRVKP